jgi:hypothetical protein
MKTAVLHKNDLKFYMRPDTRSWETNPEVLTEVLDEFKVVEDLVPARFYRSWKDKVIFADIGCGNDLEFILEKASTDAPNALLVAEPAWKEKIFWWMLEAIPGRFVELPDSDDCFLESDSLPVERVLWMA